MAPLLLVRFWGRYTNDLGTYRQTLRRILECPSVLVSTPQRIISLLDSARPDAVLVVEALRNGTGLLVVDEAHRAAAPSYRRILEELVSGEQPAPVVGLTATPFRMEYVGDDPDAGTAELREIFRDLIEAAATLGASPRARLQERGVLARPELEVIETHTSMRMPEIERAESMAGELSTRLVGGRAQSLVSTIVAKKSE